MCKYGTVIGTTAHADGAFACCQEGWRSERDDLKAACDVKSDTFSYVATTDNADPGTCTLTQLEISPTVNSLVKTDSVLQNCCYIEDEENYSEEEKTELIKACEHIAHTMTIRTYD